ncbi:Alpha/Beta hydrolase protein, partial [Podospora aff. communis PSN243]
TVGTYTISETGENVCKAGSKQWAGLVNVSEGNSVFYWFFESKHQPETDPVIVWIDGGPGISSMMGLFLQAGPCRVQPGANTTIANPHSWTNFANVLFIDNPAGVGFSHTTRPPSSASMPSAASDINTLLTTFFTTMFPHLATNPLHLVGESIGGHWVPHFASHIHTTHPITSIILLNGVVSQTHSGDGALYDHFCDPERSNVLFNHTACTAMAETQIECDFLSDQCVETYDEFICRAAFGYCGGQHGRWYNEYGPGMPDPYDDRFVCREGEFACGNFDMGFVEYLNRREVKRALRVDEGVEYRVFNATVNRAWGEKAVMAVPTTREVSWILEETEMWVLVVNGNNDAVVETSGQKRVFEHIIRWKGQAAFRLRRFVDWFWTKDGELVKGGELKSVGKLAFVTVDDAGHLPALRQPEPVSFVVKCWITGGRGEKCPRLGD